jgi:hypothetical protein
MATLFRAREPSLDQQLTALVSSRLEAAGIRVAAVRCVRTTHAHQSINGTLIESTISLRPPFTLDGRLVVDKLPKRPADGTHLFLLRNIEHRGRLVQTFLNEELSLAQLRRAARHYLSRKLADKYRLLTEVVYADRYTLFDGVGPSDDRLGALRINYIDWLSPCWCLPFKAEMDEFAAKVGTKAKELREAKAMLNLFAE